MSDNWKSAGERPLLVNDEEFTARMGNVSPDRIFMTALTMLLKARGGQFSFTNDQLDRFRSLHGHYGQLGIKVVGDQVTVFLMDEPVAEA